MNPDLPGERPMSNPLDHEDLIEETAFLYGFELYFCLETRAKLEKLAIYMNHNGQPNIYSLGNPKNKIGGLQCSVNINFDVKYKDLSLQSL